MLQAWNRAAKPRDEMSQVRLLWSPQIFHFHPEKRGKNKPTNFPWKYGLWKLRFLGKIVGLFHNNMQARYPFLIKFCQTKPSKFMSSKDTHLTSSYLALVVCSLMMLVNEQTPSCCFVAACNHIRLKHVSYVVGNTTSTPWFINILLTAISCYLFCLKFTQK